jgi:hypothetical protein
MFLKMPIDRIRFWGAGFWSLGLAAALFQPLLAWLIFSLAALMCFWAEKREFSTRVALYRLHDQILYSPWRYLFLHTIWIGILGAWKNFFSAAMAFTLIAMPAHFLFSRIGIEKITLDLDRLRWPFLAYSVASIFTAAFLFVPNVEIGSEIILYSCIGLPFLFWNLLEDRPIIHRSLSIFSLLIAVSTLYLLRPRACLLILSANLFLFILLMIYKKLRLWRTFLFVCVSTIALLLFLYFLHESFFFQKYFGKLVAILDNQKAIIEAAFSAAKHSLFLGVGASSIHSGLALRLLQESGVFGLMLYIGFFAQLLWQLFRVRRVRAVVVSNVAFLSVLIYLGISRHYLTNPYGIAVWVWYAIWVLISSTNLKTQRRI